MYPEIAAQNESVRRVLGLPHLLESNFFSFDMETQEKREIARSIRNLTALKAVGGVPPIFP